MSQEEDKQSPIGFEGLNVDEPAPPAQAAASSATGGGEDIQLLTPDEQALQVCAYVRCSGGIPTQCIRANQWEFLFVAGRVLAHVNINEFYNCLVSR